MCAAHRGADLSAKCKVQSLSVFAVKGVTTKLLHFNSEVSGLVTAVF